MNHRLLSQIVPPLIVLAGLTLLAEALVRLGGVPSWLLPAPSSVFIAMSKHWESLGPALGQTALAAGTGFAASAVIGTLLAVVLSSSRWIERAFYPYAIFFQTVPIVAIAPLLVIWCGYGMRSVIVSALIVSIFPVIANTLAGLLSTDPALRDLFRLYKAGRWATLWKLNLPSALPQIFTGLRVAAGLAVVGTIVGEFFSGQGLGSRMDEARKWTQTDVVFAAILLASLLGLALFSLVNLAGHLALKRWHASEKG